MARAKAKKPAAKRKPAARKTTAKRKAPAKRATTLKAPAKRAPAKRKTTAKKTTARKTTAKKATTRTTTTVKKAAPKKITKLGSIKAPMTKAQVVSRLSEISDAPRKDVKMMMDELANIVHAHIKKGAAGEFNFHGLMKFKVVRKPATKARKGINPFTGEETMFKAKPARNVVKVRPLKKLKEMAS